MTLHELSIAGMYVSSYGVFQDERGFFKEWFKAEEIASIDSDFSVQQANYSKSNQWVIRGIHYSLAPQGQAKVLSCASGKIIDVTIDLRVGSPTFLRVEYIELSEDSGEFVYIPSGVGHGFIVKSAPAAVVYLTSSKYSPEFEKAICPTDIELGINWPLPVGELGIISKADTEASSLAQAEESGSLPTF